MAKRSQQALGINWFLVIKPTNSISARQANQLGYLNNSSLFSEENIAQHSFRPSWSFISNLQAFRLYLFSRVNKSIFSAHARHGQWRKKRKKRSIDIHIVVVVEHYNPTSHHGGPNRLISTSFKLPLQCRYGLSTYSLLTFEHITHDMSHTEVFYPQWTRCFCKRGLSASLKQGVMR